MMSEVVTGDTRSQADFTKQGPSITEDNPAAQVVAWLKENCILILTKLSSMFAVL